MEQQIPTTKTAAKQDTWSRHLERLEASGLTQVAYCQREGLKVANLQYWKRRLAPKTAPTSNQLRFVSLECLAAEPVSPDTTIDARTAVIIRIHFDGIILEAPENIDPARLHGLVSVLRAGGRHVAN
jgi:hypothetical protein